jgi:tetratricopeptide (TPR) repeat protein
MAGKKPFVMRLATRWLATLCPLLIAATIAACDNVTPEEHIERAQEHLEKGSRNAAIIELKNALQKDRQNPTARLLLGETYLASSNLEAAEKELRHARNYGAEPGRVMDALGATLLRLGKASAILREFEDSAEFSPGRRSKVLFLRATAYYLEGSLDAAMLEFERVLAVDENNLAALIGLSTACLVFPWLRKTSAAQTIFWKRRRPWRRNILACSASWLTFAFAKAIRKMRRASSTAFWSKAPAAWGLASPSPKSKWRRAIRRQRPKAYGSSCSKYRGIAGQTT